MSTPKKYRPNKVIPYMGDKKLGNEFVPYENMPFVEERKPEDMAQTIITIGTPLKTLLANMDRGQCNNTVAKASVELSIESLRIAIRALRGER